MKKREGFVLNVYTCFPSEILCVFLYIFVKTLGEKKTQNHGLENCGFLNPQR